MYHSSLNIIDVGEMEEGRGEGEKKKTFGVKIVVHDSVMCLVMLMVLLGWKC